MKKSTTILIILLISVLFIFLGAKCPREKEEDKNTASSYTPSPPPVLGTWAWDGTDWTLLKNINEGPPTRGGGAMVYDSARQRIVLFSGSGGRTVDGQFYNNWYYDDTWEFDGTTWIQCFSTITPWARSWSGMAYDSTRQRTVLFGGYTGAGVMNNETWERDGTNWAQKFPAISPPVRDAHGMAYDEARGKVILFGGYSIPMQSELGDTWEWDGVNWTQLFPINNPSSRHLFGMAYDSVRQRIILCGGYGPNLSIVDTWEWDGTNWTDVTPLNASSYNNPSSRMGLSLAYDAVRQRTVLYGGVGIDPFYPYCLVWEWNGINWTGKTTQTRPGSRLSWTSYRMVYDSIRQKVIMFP